MARPPPEVARASPEDRNVIRVGRKVADAAGLCLSGIDAEELTKLGTATLNLRQKLADAEEAYHQLQNEAGQLNNEHARRFFMTSLGSNAFCRQITDENLLV